MSSIDRSVRVFLSSTFRDFGEERDLLVRKVFPGLRSRLRDRFVDLVDVDLRWGITVEQAERGEVLPICLMEIDRARPFFVGMLGERYGWVPPADAYAADLLERQPWLEEHRGGRSVTELEILHGVLNDPRMAGRAFFYFRAAAYSAAKGGDYVAASPEDAARQADLKDRIRRSGFPVMEDYPTPEAFAERLEADLWRVLDEAFPADEVPDAFERESHRHEAYAAPRRRLYLGGERYLAALDAGLEGGSQRVLVEGRSGGGKSALLANWLERRRKVHPAELVHVHYTGASADAADPHELVRRLCEAIKRRCGSEEEIPSDRQKLLEALPTWLAYASAHAARADTQWLIVVDALNGITDLRDLRWFPEFLPERVRVVVSCLPGEVLEALGTKGAWSRLEVEPLTGAEREELLRAYLARYNKTLPDQMVARVMAHPLSSNPLFVRTLAEELRVFGVHEELEARLGECLTSVTVDDLFERVLERVEQDCGTRKVRDALTAIWASRAGLVEEEILGVAGLVPATWAPIRYALEDALLDSGGRLTFAHGYLRQAVADRYLPGEGDGRAVHARLAAWFEGRPVDARSAEEVPYQWRTARAWERLQASLTRREMFDAVYASRSNEELLSYWLELEAEAEADLEREYEAAWAGWALDEAAEATGDLASSLQSFLRFAGRYKEFTLRLAQLALAIAEKVQGPEHPETGACLSNLALLLYDQGDYGAADPLYRRALLISKKALGPHHPDTGVSLNNLAGLLQGRGDYAGAEPLFRRALSIAGNALGSEHPSTGRSLNNLAELLKAQGDYAAAEPLCRRALAIREKALGPEHPSTGANLNSLAGLLEAQGDYAAAEPLYRRALALREKALGPEHPWTGSSLNSLAGLLKAQGHYAAAERLYRRALAISEKALGPEHPQTGSTLSNLAGLLQARGDFVGAEQLYRRALAITEEALGSEHPWTSANLNNLALLLKKQGDYAGAEPLYRRALAISKKALGAEHRSTGINLSNLAGLLKARGDYTGAESSFRRALAIMEKALGAEHLDTGTALNNLAELLHAQGDYAGAEPLYRRALAIAERLHGSESPQAGACLYRLGNNLEALGRIGEAEALLRRELAIAVAKEGTESPSVASSLRNLGVMLRNAGRHDEAASLLDEALEIHRKRPSTEMDIDEMTAVLSALGQARLLQARLNDAEALLQECLSMRTASLKPGDERIALVARRLAEVRARIGEGN